MCNDQRTLSAEEVKSWARELGADEVGVARAHPVAAKELFLAWLASGYGADMDYLHRYQDQRFDPEQLLPGARSIIVLGSNYYPKTSPDGPLRVAKYAWGEDYHRVLRRILKKLRTRLQHGVPGLSGRICVDTAPFPDKYWAMQAGLGWQGKHTNLVSRRMGSWLLLGSLVIDSPLDTYDAPHMDFCGSCRACLDACPTGAFPKAYQLDARRCISYWNIESRAHEIPEAITKHLDDWVFGCDICLDVCPWNKFESQHSHPAFKRTAAVTYLEEGSVADLRTEDFDTTFRTSPLSRPGREGLIRNIRACTSSSDSAEG
jgi:epoxyqueuosine reductase